MNFYDPKAKPRYANKVDGYMKCIITKITIQCQTLKLLIKIYI